MDPLLLCYDRQSTSLRQNHRMPETGLHVLISSTRPERDILSKHVCWTLRDLFDVYGHRTDVLACRTPIHHVQADV